MNTTKVIHNILTVLCYVAINLDIHNIAKFKLRTPYNGTLEVYDLSMSKIFNTSCYNDGEYLTCQWNGLNDNGQKIANGIYFCKVTAGNEMIWEKIGVMQLK